MTEPVEPIGRLVRTPKTAELIATDLRTRIVRGVLRAGDALPPETLLMAQFGVSRPTLREAFRILETESLIAVRRGARGGAYVLAPDRAVASRYVGLLLQLDGTTIGDVHQARAVLEAACAARLARIRTRQDLLDLRACVEDLRAAAGADPDPVRWGRHAARFHELVLQRCGSRTLAVQCGVLQDIVATHTGPGGPGQAGLPRRLLRSYARLADLVEARDAEGAERHWRTHLESSARGPRRSTAVVDLFR
ncbi:FadR family transcriptional regulator [Dactylosporangium aurantiacum]|uniref:FadR family transcriptional regulator n=1 Tax=Dactylosporangium aurantiacum TaxID=35754 RepID=A0A9Q9IAZ0_9ACTN|nr:FCD domain-containing protein [Dactylosporangium aurantiacum]MDG6102632.1 FCD domain-containing protein [Dactylosporangium aurantiacum]UWZ53114.1 FadR family transcriptional regulator [Dactylosporangium aurantiacum]